jgi:hypothetical protein
MPQRGVEPRSPKELGSVSEWMNLDKELVSMTRSYALNGVDLQKNTELKLACDRVKLLIFNMNKL